MGGREEFEQALDSLWLRKSDAILVLRNWDRDENAERVALGVDLLAQSWAPVMLLLFEEHTKAEVQKVRDLMERLDWESLILVTHRYHSYRAYLTFVQSLKGTGVRLYMKSVPSGIELGERQKIESYGRLGDCATYQAGSEYIKWLLSH